MFFNEPRLPNLGSARTKWHNENLNHLCDGLNEAYTPYNIEVFGLFDQACSDGGVATRADEGLKSLSARRSLVPDLIY